MGKIADAVGTTATAIGVSSGNLKILQGASKVMQGANSVYWSANALDKIQDLPISKSAKQIAGQKIKIMNWKKEGEIYTLIGELNKKQYTIQLFEAVASGEIKLK